MNTEVNNDYLASEMLGELKAQNKRQFWVILVELAIIIAVVIGFLVYLNQYDFSGTTTELTTQSASGVYALIDSEGNVISADLTDEEIQAILESADYGDSTGSESEGSDTNP